MTARPESRDAGAEVGDPDALAGLLGTPTARARDKGRPALLDVDRARLAASPRCVVATSDAAGRCDAPPQGDPAGWLVHVLDDTAIAPAERPGDRRADGYRTVRVVVEIEDVVSCYGPAYAERLCG